MNFTYKKIGKIVEVLGELTVLEKTPIEDCVVKETGYKKHDECPVIDDSWEHFEFGDKNLYRTLIKVKTIFFDYLVLHTQLLFVHFQNILVKLP